MLDPEKRAVVGGHYYQPMRGAEHKDLKGIQTSPDGKDWSKIIFHQAYAPQAEVGVFEKVSFDVYGTLIPHELNRMAGESTDPSFHARVAQTETEMKRYLEKNGVGHPYIHPILPDLSPLDKRVLIAAGVYQFEQDTGGTNPQVFWPPETALDTDTLLALNEAGYKGVLCAPEQIRMDSGQVADNQPTNIRLPNGESIIALPFHRGTSRSLGFDAKYNADWFTDEKILKFFNGSAPNEISQRLNIMWTDGETFGHHWPDGQLFLAHLANVALAERGIQVVSINDLVKEAESLPTGQLNERSAWSCGCGDLRRWHGACACGGGDLSWKETFYSAHHQLNSSIDQVVRSELGISQDEYIELMARNFGTYIANPGREKSDPQTSLLSARASGLTAVTSCATFYSEPGTSGFMNMLFAKQALLHLRDAGLTGAAEAIEGEYMRIMSEMHDPQRRWMNGADLVNELLDARVTSALEKIAA